ncbi:hypothetical protein BDV93DRAFT_611010 [Ceratobasidium sp. AG-I]|nr:hypothetical protein BDV93DRAFT_611010 [Ceratobasidium sp. AG-I]
MSRDTDSIMSPTVSLSGVELLSDDGSAVGVGEDTAGVAVGLFDLGDGDLHIIIDGTTLETHKFLIKKFGGLTDRIQNDAIILESGEPGLEAFRNSLKILYASVIDGPFDFDPKTLISALAVATRYDYPALRAFAMDKLEKTALSAVERIRLAREFHIPSWEEPAYLELCERDEAITISEAERRRGREVDTVNGEVKRGGAGGSGQQVAVDVTATSKTLKVGLSETALPFKSEAGTKDEAMAGAEADQTGDTVPFRP